MPRFATIRAKAGAALLDIIRPGWANDIQPERLDLSSCTSCVLGQLYGRYDVGAEKLFAMRDSEGNRDVSDVDAPAARAGFVWEERCDPNPDRYYGNLTAAWKREIAKRVNV